MSSNDGTNAFGRIMKAPAPEKKKRKTADRVKGARKVRTVKTIPEEDRKRKKREPVTVFVNASKAQKYASLVGWRRRSFASVGRAKWASFLLRVQQEHQVSEEE